MSGLTQWFVLNIEPILLPLLPIIVPIVLAWVTKFVLSVWSKLPANQRAVVKDMVATAVSAVEKKYPNATKEQKKEYATNYVIAQLSAHGIRVPTTVIDPMIEAAVLELDMIMASTPLAVPIIEAGTISSLNPPLHEEPTQEVPIVPSS